jgi:hypothetical protein
VYHLVSPTVRTPLGRDRRRSSFADSSSAVRKASIQWYRRLTRLDMNRNGEATEIGRRRTSPRVNRGRSKPRNSHRDGYTGLPGTLSHGFVPCTRRIRSDRCVGGPVVAAPMGCNRVASSHPAVAVPRYPCRMQGLPGPERRHRLIPPARSTNPTVPKMITSPGPIRSWQPSATCTIS